MASEAVHVQRSAAVDELLQFGDEREQVGIIDDAKVGYRAVEEREAARREGADFSEFSRRRGGDAVQRAAVVGASVLRIRRLKTDEDADTALFDECVYLTSPSAAEINLLIPPKGLKPPHSFSDRFQTLERKSTGRTSCLWTTFGSTCYLDGPLLRISLHRLELPADRM